MSRMVFRLWMNSVWAHINYGFIRIPWKRVDGGTKMTDEIRYAMPFGPIGALAHLLFVKGTLRQIFEYRREKLDEIFPAK